MAGLSGQIRAPRAPVRLRRNATNLADNVDFIDASLSVIRLAAAGYLTLQLADTSGLGVNPTKELTINLMTDSGLQLTTTGVGVLVNAPLATDTTGITLSVGTGLKVLSDKLVADLLANGGIVLDTNSLKLASDVIRQSATPTDKQILIYDGTNSVWTPGDAPATSPLTTKGDVYTFDTDNARQPVGTDGQLLSADSTEGTGLAWIDAPSSSPLTTLGDLFGFSTVNDRLPLGTDGQTLVVDSTAPMGIKWTGTTGTDPVWTSPLSTKGDIWGFTNTDARIAVGTDGQVLKADSTQTAGVIWADESGGGSASPLTTKGDIWVYDTADDRLGVGTDDQVLTADSSQASGLKWATPTGGSGDLTYSTKVKALSGLVGYFKLGESSGTTATDEKGTQNGTYEGVSDLTLGSAGGIAGDAGTAVKFGGTAGYVLLGQPAAWDFDPSTDSFTLAMWINTTAATSGYILSRLNGTVGFGLYFTTSDLQVTIGSTVSSSGIIINDGHWHFIAGIIRTPGQAGGGELWVDGLPGNSFSTVSSDSSGSGYDWLIGARRDGSNTATSRWFSGDIQHVMIFNRALGRNEIAALRRGSSIG